MRKTLAVLAAAIMPCGVMAAGPESTIEVQRDSLEDKIRQP